MIRNRPIPLRKYKAYGRRDIDTLPQLKHLDAETRLEMKAVSAVLPFRVNDYVLDELIDWDRHPRGSHLPAHVPAARDARRAPIGSAWSQLICAAARRGHGDGDGAARSSGRLNPHPAGQMELNVPRLDGEPIPGLQHKYRETVLFFPSQGQTCHAYCTYCFRWAQFVGIDELKFAGREADIARPVPRGSTARSSPSCSRAAIR